LPSTTSRHAAVAEVLELFHEIKQDGDSCVTAEEWERAFHTLDSDGDKVITRKEWCIRRGSTHVFDACSKKVDAHITHDEWMRAFKQLDIDDSGAVSPQEWMAQRPVRLGLTPIGMGLHHWGVGVGDTFYELLAWGRAATEMVAVGASGIVACGAFADKPGLKEQWVEKARLETQAGRRPSTAWLKEVDEPRARLVEHWHEFEACGGTSRTDEEVEAWIRNWVKEHPAYRASDAFGNECNDHTFALDLIAWLTGKPFKKATDNQKGRALVYSGLALLAGAGVAYLSSRMDSPRRTSQATAAVAVAAVASAAPVVTITPPMTAMDSSGAQAMVAVRSAPSRLGCQRHSRS